MIPSWFRRYPAVPGALGLVWAVLVAAPPVGAAGAEALPPSNPALLLAAIRSVANDLVARAPITPGTRVGLRSDGDGKLEADAREAFLEALTERRIECVLLPPTAGSDAGAAGDTAGAPAASNRGRGAAAAAAAGSAPGEVPKGDWTDLQQMAKHQRVVADSLAQAGGADTGSSGAGPSPAGAGASASLLVAPGAFTLPILTLRVNEARVDYTRMYRSGLWGSLRVERRAIARVTLRLNPPRSDAVSWVAGADSSVADVVLRSEIGVLEDRRRPEALGSVPSPGLKKVVEPVLVVALVAGLVSLFYQNRP